MNNLYSKKVLKHFRNPKNLGSIKNPDGRAQVGNPVCGDVMEVTIKIKNKSPETKNQKEYIEDIKFQTLGCAAAIAVSSMLTEMVKGKSLEQASKVTNTGIARALGGLPKHKLHCSCLAAQAIKKAIEDYRSQKLQ